MKAYATKQPYQDAIVKVDLNRAQESEDGKANLQYYSDGNMGDMDEQAKIPSPVNKQKSGKVSLTMLNQQQQQNSSRPSKASDSQKGSQMGSKRSVFDLPMQTSNKTISNSTSPKFTRGFMSTNNFNQGSKPKTNQTTKHTVATAQVHITKLQAGFSSTRNQNQRSYGSDVVKKKLEFTPKQGTRDSMQFGTNAKRQGNMKKGSQKESVVDNIIDERQQDKNKHQQNKKNGIIAPANKSKVMNRVRPKGSNMDMQTRPSHSQLDSTPSNNKQSIVSAGSQFDLEFHRKLLREKSQSNYVANQASSRLYEDDKKRKEKLELMKKEKMETEQRNEPKYSFTPVTTSSKLKGKQDSKRGIEQFYQDQIGYKESVEQKNFQRQMEMAENELNQMKLNAARASKNSNKILQRVNSTQRDLTPLVHDRLYQNTLKRDQSVDNHSHTGKFNQPKLSSTQCCRDTSLNQSMNKRLLSSEQQQQLVDRLYQDNKEERLNDLTRKYDSQMSASQSGQRDYNNRVIYEKLKYDFDVYFQRDKYFGSLTEANANISQAPDLQQSSRLDMTYTPGGLTLNTMNSNTPGFNISVIGTSPRKPSINVSTIVKKGTQIKLKNYLKIMHELGFIHLKKSSKTDEQLLTDLWKTLGGTNDNAIKAENLLVVLTGIMNASVPEVLSQHFGDYSDIEGHRQVGLLCYDELDNVHFSSPDQIQKIHNKYFSLCMNRKSRPRNRSGSQQKQLTFVPNIDQNSKSIVNEKFSDRYRDQQSHLMNKSKISQSSLMNDISEIQGYAMKRKQNSLYTQRESSKAESSFDLRTNPMKKQTSNCVRKSQEGGIEAGKNAAMRKVASTVYANQSKNTNFDSNGLDREDSNTNIFNYFLEKAFLFIDVNLGKDLGIQRLVLYENDSPRTVAERFSKKYNLPNTKQEKLAKMLRVKLEENQKKQKETVKDEYKEEPMIESYQEVQTRDQQANQFQTD